MAKKRIAVVGLAAFLGAFALASCGKENTTTTETTTDVVNKDDDNTTETKKEDITGISFTNASFVYDGNPHSLQITGNLPNGVTVSYTGNNQTNAGEYKVTAKFADSTGKYNVPADMEATLKITKLAYNMSGISFADLIVPYDGQEHELTLTGSLPDGVSVSYSANKLTDLGEEVVTATFTVDENHEEIGSMTATLKIFDGTANEFTNTGDVVFNSHYQANITVKNSVTTYDLSNFELPYGATYKVYSDFEHNTEIDKIVNLEVESNSFYIVATAYDGSTTDYIVNIYRNAIRTITIETQFGDNIDTVQKEEGLTIDTAPTTPPKAGYTFDHFEVNGNPVSFPYDVVSDATIKAVYTANDNTEYTVKHYLQNLNNDEYTLDVNATEVKQGTTDTLTAVTAKTSYTGFVAQAITQKTITGDNKTVIEVYYDRETYTVSLDDDSVAGGTVSGLPTGKVKYGYKLNLTASAANLGYNSLGFIIDNNDESEEGALVDYVINKDTTISVYKVKDEMKDFTFESTATTCEVKGLKNGATVTDLVMPEYVTSISEGAFKNNTDITTITINNSIMTVGQFAFGGCTSVTTITMPGIDGFANTDYQKLFKTDSSTDSFNKNGVKLIISNEITSICNYQFSYINWMNEIVLPDTVKSLGQGALKECKNLKTVTLPSNVSVISTDLFQLCTSLTTVNFNKDKVRKIGAYAFYGCSALESIDMPNYLFQIDGLNSYAFAGCTSLKSITIPKGVDRIDNSLFSSCTALESVEILSTSLKLIQPYAFNGCTNLKSITIPNTVTTIGKKAFYECQWLSSVVVPDSVTSIGDYAFYHCYRMTSAVISKNITTIPTQLFGRCSELKTITMPLIAGDTANATYNKLFNGENSNTCYANYYGVELIINNDITSIPDSIFWNNEWLASITIPSTVTTIKDAAFSTCKKLSTVNLPYGLTTIEGFVFNSCSSLTSIDIPVTVTTIGESAFYSTGLTSIVLPEYVTTISKNVFSYASSLESVYIQGKITSIGGHAFEGCTKLKDIYYFGTEAEWNAITGLSNSDIPSTVTMHYGVEATQSTLAIIRDAGAITFTDNAGTYDVGGANTIDLSTITVNKDATYVVAKDANGTDLWTTKQVSLEIGNNDVYIIVTSPNGKITNTYKLTITR